MASRIPKAVRQLRAGLRTMDMRNSGCLRLCAIYCVHSTASAAYALERIIDGALVVSAGKEGDTHHTSSM
eukprot:3333483-Pleurochrysis_carterae.AAC.2